MMNFEFLFGPRRSETISERNFVFENISFDYHLMLQARKTISITVDPTQAVIVKAPFMASSRKIEDFMRRRVRWIMKQRRYFSQFKAVPEKKYVSGETFRYRGRNYKLLVKNVDRKERVALQHGTLTVYTVSSNDPDRVKKLLDSWYLERARVVFQQRLDECFEMFKSYEKPGLRIRKMKRRWGSYSLKTHRVNLNLELIKAATRYLDYVIVHELCHMTNGKHDRAFYELLASKQPRWKQLKSDLELSLLGVE